MSVIRRLITQIENLNVEQFCEALEYNGYGEFSDCFRNKSIDGQEFLKLTEVQISLWRLPTAQMRRLWSFIEHVRQNPSNFQLVRKKTSQVTTPPISNFNNSQKNFYQSNSLGRPTLKQKPKFAEPIQNKNVESSKFSSLTKEDSKLVRGKLEQLFKVDPKSSSFLHKKSMPPKSPINNYVEQNYDDDDDLNDGYLPPIINQQSNLRSPVVENQNTFLHRTRESYVNHNIESELRPPTRPNHKKHNERPLPPIPQEMASKFDPPKFQNIPERQNLVPQKPGPKTSSIFKRPIKQMLTERQRIEDQEEELNEYTTILAEQHVPFTRPLPEIPTEYDEDLAEYGTISEEDEELDTKFRFNPINQHPNFLSQLKSAANQKHKQNIVKEEEFVYDPVLDEEEEKEMFVKPSINIRSRPLPPPPILPNQLNQRENEDRFLPPVPVLSKRPNQIRPESLSDSDEESVMSEVMKMSLLAKPFRTPDKSRSPINLPKPPSMLPKPPQFETIPKSPQFGTIPKSPQFGTIPKSPQFGTIPKSPQFGTIPKDDFKKEAYYRETDRRGARMILNNLEEGTFLIRPSRDGNYICTLSIMHHTKMFNVGVQRDGTTGFVTLGNINVEQPDFRRLQDIINYYCVHPLCLSGQIIVLKNILPFDRR